MSERVRRQRLSRTQADKVRPTRVRPQGGPVGEARGGRDGGWGRAGMRKMRRVCAGVDERTGQSGQDSRMVRGWGESRRDGRIR